MEIFRQITANNIELKPYPFIKELAMEAYLIENEDVLKLDTDNFAEVNILDAEIALKGGRKTSNRDGRIDILARYGFDYLSIVELKMQELNDSTLDQLEDYLLEKDQILEKFPEFWQEESEPNWIGVLVGSSISPELQRKLQDGYKTESGIAIAGLVIKRFRNEKGEIYVVTDTFFKYKYSSRDFSKFQFRGVDYNKSRLVNQVIKSYVEDNPTATYADLNKAFPKSLQGSSGVFDLFSKARETYEQTGYKRHYIHADELIKLQDCIIATSTQWGKGNINSFIEKVNGIAGNYQILSM